MIILGVTSSSDKNIPSPPTMGTAVNVGTSRAYNNGAATVPFTPNYSGGLPVTYTITSSPGSFTGTGSSSPITVAGLQSATAYTFTGTATNSLGTSAASAASNSITATTVPQAPTIGTATDGGTGTTVSVAFTPGATGGSAITTYTATSSPGGFTGTAASSPITVSGLTAGTAYTFTVTATNANGTSQASAASNSVTPALPNNYEFIASVDATGGKTYIIQNIPQTYKSLQYRIYNVNYGAAINVFFNQDASGNYMIGYTLGSGITNGSSFYSNSRINTGSWLNGGAPYIIIDIPRYLGSSVSPTGKTAYISSSNGAAFVSGANDRLYNLGGMYNSTTAVTSITSQIDTNAWYGTMALYGLQ